MGEQTESPETFEQRVARISAAHEAGFEYDRIALESVDNLRKELAGAESNAMADHDVAFYCAKSFVYLKRWASLNQPDFVAEIENVESSGDAAERLAALERLVRTAGLG